MSDRRPRRPIVRATLSVAALVALAVAALGVAAAVDDPPSGPVRYQLAWSTDGVTVEEASWSTTNDLGYEVTVEAGSLSTWSVTLGDCPDDRGPIERILDVVAASPLGGGVAAAGHTSGGTDPALVQEPTVQSLIEREPVTLGPAELVERRYCTAHTAVAGAIPDGAGATERLPTVSVTGTATAPGAAQAVPFHIETTAGWGAIADLEDGDGASADLSPGQPVTVVVERRLGSMFDGVDFAAADAQAQAEAVLAAITETTVVRVAA